jgi:hypothetical protein
MPADANSLPNLPARWHFAAEFVNHANYFVPWHARKLDPWPDAVFGEYIAVADPAGFDLDADVSGARLGNRALDEFKRAAGT